MSKRKFLFTSESVGEGHPDKIADQTSDAVLDACLRGDPQSRVACEVFTTTGMVWIGGEITTETYIDIPEVTRGVVKRIGYDRSEYGLDYSSMAVMTSIHGQSADISQGVSGDGLYQNQQGAGDQGMMFGFACRETPELMPAPIMLAHRILLKAAQMRKEGKITWLRPDSKSQVTVEYEDGNPKRVDTVVLSHQHDEDISYSGICTELTEKVIKSALEPYGLVDDETKYFINPTGRFVIGGPHGDTGLTGRKIIVDTYGGMGRHGGGAFSGKDPSKVDRSAAYMARYAAKNVVAAELCDRCEIQVAYAIGVPFPVSITVDAFGTEKVPEEKIERAVEKVFDFTPAGIVDVLQLRMPIYQDTAVYGHFGRNHFAWEKTDRIAALQKEVG